MARMKFSHSALSIISSAAESSEPVRILGRNLHTARALARRHWLEAENNQSFRLTEQGQRLLLVPPEHRLIALNCNVSSARELRKLAQRGEFDGRARGALRRIGAIDELDQITACGRSILAALWAVSTHQE